MSPHAPWIVWLAQVLIHQLWWASAVALVIWLVLRQVRAAEMRHAVVLGGFGLIAAGLLIGGVLALPRDPMVVPPALVVSPTAEIDLAGIATPPPADVPLAGGGPALPWRAALVVGWAVGVILSSARFIGGWWRVRALVRTAMPAPGDLERLVRTLADRMGVTAPILRVVCSLAVPAVAGWWRPVVLLPAGFVAGVPAAHLEAVLLHELAHLARRDWLAELLVSLLETALFYHPAVWWLGRRLRAERELCCDGRALAQGADPSSFAQALLVLAEGVQPAHLLSAGGGDLAQRVGRILGRPATVRPGALALAAILAAPLAIGLLAACARSVDSEPAVVLAPIPVTVLPPEAQASSLPLAERIRLRAIGAPPVKVAVRVVDMPADGAAAPRLLDPRALAAVEAALSVADAATYNGFTITARPGEAGSAGLITQYAFIANYTIAAGHLPDPCIEVLKTGDTLALSAVPERAGIRLAALEFRSTSVLGSAEGRLPWDDDAGGGAQLYPFEEPLIAVSGTVPLAAPVLLEPGAALLVPITAPVIQRLRSPLRGMVPGITEDPAPALRAPHGALPGRVRVALITAAAATPWMPGAPRLVRRPGTPAWIDAPVTLAVEGGDLAAVLKEIAGQTKAPLRLPEDADTAATRITLHARGEPLAGVLERLLVQTVYDAEAGPGGLVLMR